MWRPAWYRQPLMRSRGFKKHRSMWRPAWYRQPMIRSRGLWETPTEACGDHHPGNNKKDAYFYPHTGRYRLQYHLFLKLHIGDTDECNCGISEVMAWCMLEVCPVYAEQKSIWVYTCSISVQTRWRNQQPQSDDCCFLLFCGGGEYPNSLKLVAALFAYIHANAWKWMKKE